MNPEKLRIEKTRAEKIGRNFMIAGFALIVTAAASFFLHRQGPVPGGLIGRPLLIAGIAVYFLGRTLYWRGRRQRRKREIEEML